MIKNNYPIIRPALDLNFAGSKTVDPRITFTRASTATYYDGKTVAKAEENLLLYSQEFDNAAWTKTDATVTANSAIAPDGTTTADTLTATANNATLTQSTTAIAAQYTFSIYLKRKAGTGAIEIQSASGAWTSVAVTDSWVRFDVATTPAAGSKTSGVRITVSGDELYVWAGQLEQRSQITAYTPTTDQPITRYQPVLLTAPANTPRIDHDPITGECKGLLVEESRTNLVVRSEEFDSANWGWASTGSVVLSNVVLAPNGTLTADKVVEDTTTGGHRVIQAFTLPDNADYTGTVYIKSAERSRIAIQYRNKSGVVTSADFNLLTKSALGSAEITEVGGGWFRLKLSFNSGSGASTPYMAVLLSVQESGSTSYTGDGYSGIYIWGAQLEVGAFPTSYIKTEASQVTRAADNASMTGTNFSSWYRQDEGTIAAEYVAGLSNSAQTLFTVNDNTSNNRISLFADSASDSASYPSFIITSNSAVQVSTVHTEVSKNSSNKFAGYYATNAATSVLNSGTPLSDSTVVLPSVFEADIGSSYGSWFLNGHIKRLTYYPKRLSNQQLQALTL